MFNLFKNEHSSIALKLTIIIAGIVFFIVETSTNNNLNTRDSAFANIDNNVNFSS